MCINRLAWVWLFLIACSVTNAQEVYSKVKIFAPEEREARAQLLGLLEIDHAMPTKDGAIVTEISASELARLRQTPYRYEVVVPDVRKRLDSLNEEFFRRFPTNEARVAFEQPGSTINAIIQTPTAFQVQPTFGGYYSYAQIVTAIDNLVAAYPTIASKNFVATTAEGRTVWAVKISDNVGTDEANEPEILYLGLQHAREAIGGSSMIFFMQYLCERYAANDARIRSLVNNREFYIVPCFNPDGWEYNRTSMGGSAGGGWRKNRRPNGGTSYGVDLNRNWGVDWADCSAPILGPTTSCGSGTSTADTYWGPSAFSEPETAGIRSFVQARRFVAGFDQHAYGPYYSLPFGRKSKHTMPQKGVDFYTAVPALMGAYNGMRAADSYDALAYEVAGGFKDWMLMGNIGTGTKDTVWAMTGEGGAGGGSGGTYSDFWAPASQIINLCKGMVYQNLQLAYAAGSYVDIQDASDINLTSLAGNLSFNLRRLGLGNDPVTVSLIPLENIQDVEGPMVIPSMTYYQNYTGNMAYTLYPGTPNGTRLRFVWQVTTGGITFSDTITKFYNATSLFFDNMDGTFGTNWTNTAAATASGFGYNYTAGSFVFTTSGGYNSTKALSESAAGTRYSGSSIRIAQCNSTFNLTGSTSAYLSFWIRHRAENFRDRLQIQVSTNGTTWVPLEASTTIEEPGTLDDATINGQPSFTGIRDYWIRELVDLSGYLNASALRFRFVFMSDNDPSSFAFETDEGFFIDDVRMVRSTAALTVLPVQYLSFSARLQNDNTVHLLWDAKVDSDHDHFIVERSVDGRTFTSIARVNGSATPFSFIDSDPVVGNNFYRIRQVDHDGTAHYSAVRQVSLRNSRITLIYPNPVTDYLQVQVRNRQPERLMFEVVDAQGRTVQSFQKQITPSAGLVTIDMKALPAQVYLVNVRNLNGELIGSERIVKQ